MDLLKVFGADYLEQVFGADYLDQDVLDGFLWDCLSVKDLTVSGQFRAGRSVQTLTQEEHALTSNSGLLAHQRAIRGEAAAPSQAQLVEGWIQDSDEFWRGYGFHVYRCIIGSSSTTFYGEVVERPDARDIQFYFANDPRFKFPVRLRVHLEEEFKGGAWLFYLLGCFQRLTDVNITKDLPPEHDLIIPEVQGPEDAHDGFKWCTKHSLR
ncbi:hypothetical protein CRG98_013397 [Punica granatum]|uniref:Uncharacterized protein n=1 Tax=Punica granatum TaxID=22663 RepID=A0A2I0KCG1_PUNGR|nr:hypothetical protein CRG98_013397 [Punica granatum]